MREELAIAGRVADRYLAARAERVDIDGEWPREGMEALLEQLGGLVVPARDGGRGGGLTELAGVCEILGGACASTAICFGMHCVASAVLSAKRTEHQAAAFLRPIAEGRHLTTLALSEPGSGAHFWFPSTRLTHGEGWLELNGEKSFVTNGRHADSYVVSTVADRPDAPPGEFSCVVVPADADGLTWGPRWDGMGMRGNASRGLCLRGTRVERHHLLGKPGDQIWYVFSVVAPYFLIAMAATYVGVAARALEIARDHLATRRHAHSGRVLADDPLLQHDLGELWVTTEHTRQMVRHAASSGDADPDEALPSLCAAKIDAARAAVDVVNGALTLVGGRGYAARGELDRMLRNARAAHVMSPTTQLLRKWIGRTLLGRNLLIEP